MKKTVSIVFAVLFLALCLVPSLGMLAGGVSAAGANEVLASAPALKKADGSLNAGFLSDFSDYVGDRFFLRQQAITAWNALNAGLLRSSCSDDVILGSDGWLYYADTLADYTGSDPMSDRELWCAARAVALMREYAESRGCAFLFTLAPDKNALYGEHMPAYVRSGAPTDAERFAAALAEQGVAYLDLFSVFRGQDEALYFRTDSHWTARGAALAADALLSALGRESAWFGTDFSVPQEHRGDLYEMLYPAGTATETEYASAAPFSFTYTQPFRTASDISIRTASADGSGSLLLFRDSFGINLYPYLAEEFGTALFSRLNPYDLSLADESGADTVVIELVERNLRYLNRYAPVYPAPERAVETAGAAEDGGSCAVSVSASSLDGCLLVNGTLPEGADDDSPVYLLSDDGAAWEATPLPGGFAAHLPAGAGGTSGALRAAFFSAGRLTLTDPFPCETKDQ